MGPRDGRHRRRRGVGIRGLASRWWRNGRHALSWQLGRRARRVSLAVHVAVSIGWMGAVAAFSVIAGYGATVEPTAAVVPGIYSALLVMMWAVIVPFAVLSLLSGVVQALGTTWGLFRHYWVVVKLCLTAGATALLLLHTRVAESAMAFGGTGSTQLRPLQVQLLVDSVAGLVVLLFIALLGWIKPKGLISNPSAPPTNTPTSGDQTPDARV